MGCDISHLQKCGNYVIEGGLFCDTIGFVVKLALDTYIRFWNLGSKHVTNEVRNSFVKFHLMAFETGSLQVKLVSRTRNSLRSRRKS